MSTFAVIIPAAGASRRFGGGNKLLSMLAGVPVIARAVKAFASRDDVACIIVAASDAVNEIGVALAGVRERKPIVFCPGGAHRAGSVLNALRHVPNGVAWVAVHDAARPLVSQQLIDATFAAALEHGAAVPALQVALTVKQARGPLPAKVERTIPRHSLWAMQTPQVMKTQSLLRALSDCPLPIDQITDDAQAIELKGEEVWLIEGDLRNLKITTAADLKLAQMLLETSDS